MKKLILLTILIIFAKINPLYCNNINIIEPKQFELSSVFNNNIKNDWYYLVKALIWVESNNRNIISGPGKYGSCYGPLQITQIYIDQVNIILRNKKHKKSHKRYVLQDAFDLQKSLEMFQIYQNHFNSKHNIIKAIKLHNPTAGKEYLDNVLFCYNYYLEHQEK